MRDFLPTLCLICSSSLHRGLSICSECEKDLPWLANACRVCAEALDVTGEDICHRCRLNPPPFSTCHAPFAYRSPVDRLIVNYKFNADFASGYALSRMLARTMTWRWQDGNLPDLLLPVPLHITRLRQRGFNQALEITRVLSAESGVPFESRSLFKLRPGRPQTEMQNAHARGANVRSSFGLSTVSRLRRARRVALVDDVVTTMSTVTELTNLLKSEGVEEVEVCCLARAGL